MPKRLSAAQIEQYRDQGFLAPIDFMNDAEAAENYGRFEALETSCGGDVSQRFRIKAHLPFPWLCDLIRDARLLDVIEDIIGPDILCWGATFFIKKPGDQRFISWHTDSYFYGTRPNETLTAWVSFNASDLESGCIKFIPGTHKTVAVHELRPDPLNMSSNGQTVVDTDDSSDVVNVEKIIEGLIADGKADAFFTCGSNRLLTLMKRLGIKHDIPGQVAMEQIMACGLGACYICMRTFEVNGERVLRRVCREGPVFNIQETVGW